jgi:hypothetical protein
MTALSLLDNLHASLTGRRGLNQAPALAPPLATEQPEAAQHAPQYGDLRRPIQLTGAEGAAMLLRIVGGVYLKDIASEPSERFLIGEANTARASMNDVADILFAVAGAVMMLRPGVPPAIDHAVLTAGATESPVHFGRAPFTAVSRETSRPDEFSNEGLGLKFYILVLSFPRSASRMDRLRSLIRASTIDGLSFKDRGGAPFTVGDRYLLTVMVSSPSLSPRRVYEALLRSGAVDRGEVYQGLNQVDPFAARGQPDVAYAVFVPGRSRGLFRKFGTTAERPLPRAVIDFFA